MTTRRTTTTMIRECANCGVASQGASPAAACTTCEHTTFQYRCPVCQVVANKPLCACAEPKRAKRVLPPPTETPPKPRPPKPRPTPDPVPYRSGRWVAAEAVRTPAFGLQLTAIFNLLLALPVALLVPTGGPTRFAFYAGLFFLLPYSLAVAIGAWRLRELSGPHWPFIGAFLGLWAFFVWAPFCILGWIGTLSATFCVAGWLVSAVSSSFGGYCLILLRRPEVRRAIGARE